MPLGGLKCIFPRSKVLEPFSLLTLGHLPLLQFCFSFSRTDICQIRITTRTHEVESLAKAAANHIEKEDEYMRRFDSEGHGRANKDGRYYRSFNLYSLHSFERLRRDNTQPDIPIKKNRVEA